jgi:class 3 adenylate cyclase
MSEVGERELLAIIFTDAVDSTARTASDEDFSLRILLADLEFIRNEAAVRGGLVLKNTGDGLLISFKSAVDAVECALSIQRGFANRPQKNSFSHKIGVHIGDVIKKDGDIYGSGVNTASRLVAKSPSGGICMSSTLYELVKQKSGIGNLKVENFQLTNIEPPIGAYRLEPSGVMPAIIVDSSSDKQQTLTASTRNKILAVSLGIGALCASWFYIHKHAAEPNQWIPTSPTSGKSYQKIRNLGIGQNYVLNCFNEKEGRGKCGLLVNPGDKNQSGQLWDLRVVGSFRNAFLGKEREISIDPKDGSIFMGSATKPMDNIKFQPNPKGNTYKIKISGRYLSVDPNRLSREDEFKVWASPKDQGDLSDWEIISTAFPLPENERKHDIPIAGALPLDAAVEKRLAALRSRNQADLAERLKEKIKKSWDTCQRYPGSRVIVGQLKLSDGKKDVRLANAQMEILEEGLFAGEVRDFRSPVGFALQGYLPAQVQLDGKNGSIVDVGEITLQSLLAADSASIKLKLTGAEQARSYTRAELFLEPGFINTPHNGTSPRLSPGWEPPLDLRPDEQNEIQGLNLSPGHYYLKISSPEAIVYEERIVLSPGQKLDMGTINLIRKQNPQSLTNPQQNP